MSESTDTPTEIPSPLYAAIGAGDFAVEAVAEVVEKLRTTATEARDDIKSTLSDAQSRASSAAESAQSRLTGAADSLPKDVDDLRARFSPDELRKVAEAYIKVATDIYESLAERGEATVGKLKTRPSVEDGIGKATEAYNNAVELTQSSLGQVAARTKELGERAAKLTGRAEAKVGEAKIEE